MRVHVLVEPQRLILTWRAPPHVKDRLRWAVGELRRDGGGVTFRYLAREEFGAANEGRSFDDLLRAGFLGYPAFKWIPGHSAIYDRGVLETFLRRLPPPSRVDFDRFIERFYIEPGTRLSPLTLLGVTGAQLPSDGFAFVDPLDSRVQQQDLILEVAGARYQPDALAGVQPGARVQLHAEPWNTYDSSAVRVEVMGRKVGYVSRFQSATISRWLIDRHIECSVARRNGTPDEPRLLLLLHVRARAAALYGWA
ncbi:hypothetical protein GWK16_21195 [Roseomonas sp. JC162]|uniref:HIRAN domain-containing protein n=1 Tax=Neoroseomonas marina TaxID=1232220 RepID=A0A848EK69_9PROT|nr:HIRAN domain-containing protein [Neoroseomonas marina]NMJ43778.1 hypothetical protein [Neoroseomonas marina]